MGEAIPDVVTPLTWSLVRALDIESGFVPEYYLWSGNICGRIYSNISQRLSAITALYGSPKLGLKILREVFGQIPEELTIPAYPFSRMDVIKAMLPGIRYYLKKNREVSKNLSQSIQDTPDWCKRTKAAIKKTNTKEELLNLYSSEGLSPLGSFWEWRKPGPKTPRSVKSGIVSLLGYYVNKN